MATPGNPNEMLKPGDLSSYQLILETQGQESADAFFTEKVNLYLQQEQASRALKQQEEIERQKLSGQETIDFSTISLTPEEQKNYSDMASGIPLQGTTRVLPGMEPGLQQIPMEEVIPLRRESIPTPDDIQTEAEEVAASITQQQIQMGFPSRQNLEDQIFEQLKQNYNQQNPGRELEIGKLFEHEIAIIEYDLRNLAKAEAAKYETAEDFAQEKIEGEFGVDRARQAGNPFESPPSPFKEGGRIALEPEEAQTQDFTMDLNPFVEGETSMGGLGAIYESLFPQTIATKSQMDAQKNVKQQMSDNFIEDIDRDIAKKNPEQYDRNKRMGGKSSTILMQSMREAEIKQRLSDFYFSEYDRIYRELKQAGAEEDEAQNEAKKAATRLTSAQIALIPDPELNPDYAIVHDEMTQKYGRMSELARTGYAPYQVLETTYEAAKEGGVNLLSDLATEEDPFTGELVESVGMAIIRDLNLPFRLILNPIEEVAENVVFGGTSGKNVGDSFYDVKTYDFTEESKGFIPTMDAYLREVAVETAKGYGTGNALANYTATESGSDGLMIGGTLVEMFLPVGAIAKGTQKLATTTLGLNKIARGLDLAADSTRLMDVVSESGQPNVYRYLEQVKPGESVGYFQSTYKVNEKIAGEAARQMEVLEAGRSYARALNRSDYDEAVRISAGMADDPLQKSLFKQLIEDVDGTNAGAKAAEFDTLLDDIGRQDTMYGDIAREIRREGGTKLTQEGLAKTGTGASRGQLTERAAERLAKYNIEDFVALTDRMSIHKDVLPERIKYIDDYVDDINKADLDSISELEVYLSQKTVRRDPELRRIMDKVDSEVAKGNGGKVMGDVLTSQEQIYITNRGLEDQLRRELGTQGNRAQLFEQTLPSTKRAMLPEELRSETGARIFGSDKVEKATRSQSITASTKNAGVAALRYADAITPGDASKFMKEVGQKIKIVAPKASRTEMVAVNRAVEQARDSVVRLERSLPESMARYGRYTTKPDEAIYSMFNRSATTDPTDILQMGDDAARMAFRMGKNNPLTNEQVLQVARGTLPTLTKADEAFILAKIGMNPVESVARLEEIIIQITDEIPRLKQGMVSRPVLGSTAPDVAKVMVAISGNNAARQRVGAIAQAELGPLSVPVKYRTPAGQKFIFDEAMRVNENGFYGTNAEITDMMRRVAAAGILETKTGATIADAMSKNLAEFEGVLQDVFDVANQLRARGLELNMTPAQVRQQMLYNVDAILDEKVVAVSGVGIEKQLAELQALYKNPETFRVVSSNVEELASKNPGLLNWTMRTLGFSAADVRRSFVSGMLGGKYIPTTRYIAENAATQMVISAITAPGSNRLMFKGALTPGAIDSLSLLPVNRVKKLARDPNTRNTLVPGTRYTYGQVSDALQTKNMGSTSQSINLGDVFLEDMLEEARRATRRSITQNIPYASAAVDGVYDQFRYIAKNPPGPKMSSTSPGMRLAMNTDYAFREQMFLGALLDGKTIDQATILARRAFFDYGDLPGWSKASWFRGTLFFSFAYRSAVETARALANPKAAANLAKLARAKVAMTKATGSYYFTGDQALQSLFVTSQGGDGDYDAVNLYYRDPWMSNLMLGANTLTYLTQAAQGDPEASVGRGIDGILDYLYMPALDVIKDLDPDFKKGVPPKTVYRILMAQQLAGNIPEIFGDAIPDSTFYVDRYDMEVRPPSKMVPGSPTFNGFQYRFQTKEGYNAFYLDSLALAIAGAGRLANDATAAMIMSGILPEGSDFTYLENGSPALYLFGRQSPMRVPKEWEIYDRQMRAQQYRLRDLKKTFGEPKDTNPGDQK